MKKRIIFDLLLIGVIFYAQQWWLIALVALWGAFLWAPYYEIIALGILADLLYGAVSLPFGGMLGVLSAFIIFFIGSYIKKAVR